MLCDKTDGPEPDFTNRLLKLQVVISTNRFSFTFKLVKKGRPRTLPKTKADKISLRSTIFKMEKNKEQIIEFELYKVC